MGIRQQIKEIRKKEDRKEERKAERKADKKKVNPFLKKKEAAASGRWATIQHDLNTEKSELTSLTSHGPKTVDTLNDKSI